MKMTLTPLDSPLWDKYHGAYGNVRQEVAIISGAEKKRLLLNGCAGWIWPRKMIFR